MGVAKSSARDGLCRKYTCVYVSDGHVCVSLSRRFDGNKEIGQDGCYMRLVFILLMLVFVEQRTWCGLLNSGTKSVKERLILIAFKLRVMDAKSSESGASIEAY